ncbi:adenylate/guanylate cyclase domain-containing protein [Marinihelvus fidelis]|uniref:Adenylate/guanylate cyclase domain-containing protein n=1 Tax=Marinihelvus fidelis TaxID=2613842 RepID=A0A5N0TDH1_9GAMM|nr:adenylate/guanylate cyclase domain-containing protein [Marinihelvus fidelis]KAA9133072.1 adenylate/guanylate cyclase domain-containing protein [Marinihelvus fidelis]
MKRYLIRLVSSLALIGLLAAHILGNIHIPFVAQFERLLYDTRVRLSAPGGKDDKIVIIALDERSLDAEGHWPWSRDKLARLVSQLYAYGVEVVGFDVVFPERDVSFELETLKQLGRQDPAFSRKLERFSPQLDRDAIFGDALAQGRSVVAFYFHTDERAQYETGDLPIAAFEFDDAIRDDIRLPTATGYSANVPEITEGAWSAGFISNPLIGEDGIVRRAPLLHAYGNNAYESLSLAMASTYLDDIALPVFVDAPLLLQGYPPLEAIVLGERHIPVDAQGAVLVPYRGGAGSFNYVSATDVINGTVPNPEQLAGSITLIGATAPGLVDLRSTPFGSIYPGVEVHANVLAGILDNSFRWQPAYTQAAELIAVLAFGLLAALVLPVLSAVYATLLLIVMVTAAVWTNAYLWDEKLHVLPLATTLIVLFGTYLLNMVYGYFFESRSRSHMNDLFGQYVPPDLVSEMAHDPTHYSMESEKRELSVLFTDIRSFTTISEALDAQELSDLLNRFLTPMTEVVHETHGTIDKYMGDCIMAFWGAPLRDANHAEHAIVAGLGMLNALTALNESFVEEGKPELKIGVGVNTGTMSVGNMGSRFRRAYTVLGDSVNLGSRLEGLTKAYGVEMLVSEFTRDAAADRFLYREIDRVRVKGKRLPVGIYEVVGEASRVPDIERARLLQFEQAMKLYRALDWDGAEGIMLDLVDQVPDKLLYRMYLQRIRTFRAEPPPADWDGVYTHDSK